MKIGFDLHGCIDKFPDTFRELSRKYMDRGDEIHIITGQEWENVKQQVSNCGVEYTDHFSIVDYNKSINTPMWQDSKGRWQMEDDIWVRSKGLYMAREHIDVHFDDSSVYGLYVPNFTTYIMVPETNFEVFGKMLLLT